MSEDDDEATIPKSEATTHDIEDEIQDWKLLSKSGSSAATTAIPKRGEKEFEPDGTIIQSTALQESRRAMYDALSSVRGHHIKQSLIGVWRPKVNNCFIAHPKGNYFRDVGRPENFGKIKGGQALNCYECVYLVERGSMVVYLADEEYETYLESGVDNEGVKFDVEGRLMAIDLEYLYCLAGLDVAKYQIYSYLKRLGYMIQEYNFDPERINPQEGVKEVDDATQERFRYLKSIAREWGLMSYPIGHSLHFKTKHYFNYRDIYKSLSLANETITCKKGNDVQITFNVWKPTNSFSKKSPPPPDFQLFVMDTSKSSSFPSLSKIHTLQNQVVPKIKSPGSGPTTAASKKKKNTMPLSKKEIRQARQAERHSKLSQNIQLRNKYLKLRDEKLKAGNSTTVFAIVNHGIINFVNLSQGNFALGKNVKELDDIYPGANHGIVCI
ncbi:SEN54 [[Candida] subhashii]|uniref:SEN54 n=1 Tax=[Candida] subhashii TaxID=561895 RepID=A0A8J5QGF0_9ASCO|nr:SEN54 [[Candida] subhashii]KAG7664101.1 SEN54 [[Candida] subhashii]